MAAKIKRYSLGDFVLSEVDPLVSRVSGKLVNTEVSERSLTLSATRTGGAMGYPLVDNGNGTWDLALLATQANIDGYLLWSDDITIAASGTTTEKYPILVKGPAVVNKEFFDTVHADDVAGGTFTANTVAGRAEAIGLTVKDEVTAASQREVQDT